MHTTIRRGAVWLVAVVGASTLGLGWLGPASAATPTVKLQANNFRFCAASAPGCTYFDSGYTTTVAPGTKVTWTYTDVECDVILPCPGHTVTFGAKLGSALVKHEGALIFSLVFRRPGTYSYFCKIHASFGMTGKIVVK